MSTELTALDELKLYREAHAIGPHRARITAQAMTDVMACAFRAVAEKDAEIARLRAGLDTIREWTAPGEGETAEARAWRRFVEDALRRLADQEAKIARLEAELDGLRDIPVEYVTAAGLEAAMAADPHRENGARIRETGGAKRTFAWRAAKQEWEAVQ